MKNIGFEKMALLQLWILIFFVCISSFSTIYASQDEKLPLNTLIEKVTCIGDKEQSYALFLPPNYSPEKKWPIIYALDPGAKGIRPVDLFKEAASKYGYIVVCSNNSQNGPWEPIIRAIKAVWEDTHSRFSIDEKRVYSVGFSGGARSAALMTKLFPNSIIGCILCGAGLPSELELKNVKSIYFIGIAGLKDFNFIEMMDLHQKMNKEAVPHRIIITDGYHSWPDVDVCTRIVEWLEIHAMSAGKTMKNEDFIEEIYDKELEAGRDLEKKKEFYRAHFHYIQSLPLFKELIDTGNLEKRIAKLKDNEEYYRQSASDLTARQTELEILGKIYPVILDSAKKPSVEFNEEKFLKDLEFTSIIDFLHTKDNPDMAYMGIRLMAQINAQLSTIAWEAMEKNDFSRAIIIFDVCRKTVENEPASKQAYWEIALACAYAANNDERNTIKYLKLGVEHGYKNKTFLSEADYFKNIRETNEFKEIISSIK